MRHDQREDLDWLAFRYIANELSGDELDAFERRLASDQKAREAVAQAVELTRAVAAVGGEAPARPTPAFRAAAVWRRMGVAARLCWTTVAVSACLALVLAYQYYRGTGPATVVRPEAPGQDEAGVLGRHPDELAIAWSRTGEELSLLQPDDRLPNSPDEGEIAEELPLYLAEDQPGEDAFASNAPPSWLIAAVQASASGAGAEAAGDSSFEEN